MANSVSSSSPNRIYGLSGSGMDVDAMVQKLMTAARQPYTKLTQQQTLLGWKKEAYNTMYTSINSFRNDKVFNFQMKSTLAAKNVTSSNSLVASVSASGDAVNVNHTLKVTQLASGVTQSSTAKITTGTSKDTMQSQFGIRGSFTINLNGKSIVVSSSQSINDLVNSINKADAGVTASYDATQDRFFLYTNSTGASTGIDFSGSSAAGLSFLSNTLKIAAYGNVDNKGITSAADIGVSDVNATLDTVFQGLSGSMNLKISNGTNSATITLDSTTSTLQDLIDKINNLKDSNGNDIGASVSYENGKFTIKSKNSDTTLDLTGSDANGTSFLNNRLKLTKQQGQDAQITLDGVSMTQATNKFVVANVTYSLQSVGTSNITVQDDVDKIINSVKTFINDYNTLLSSLNTKVTEKRDSNYMPLTDEQKSAMSEDDIKLWEEKTKTGLLNNDSILKTLSDSMRNAFASKISGITGKYTSASSIGITTSSDWSENGKLYVDEDKLRKALEEDPDAVYKIFGTTSDTASNKGIAVRLTEMLKTAADKIVDEAGTTASTTNDVVSILGKQNKDMTDRLIDLNNKLVKQENQYYTQFNAMEQALSQLNQQSSYLASMLGSSS